jgi:hypothetical protein
MKLGGNTPFAASKPGFRGRLFDPGGDLAKGSDIVLGVTFSAKGVHHDERIHETNVRAALERGQACGGELLQRKGVVEERFFIHNRLKLPLHDIGGNALVLAHRSAIECLQFRKATSGKFDARPFPRLSPRR